LADNIMNHDNDAEKQTGTVLGQQINRREFLKRAGIAAAALSLPVAGVFGGCARRRLPLSKKTLILGMDGVEPTIISPMLRQGRLPNFQRVAEMGGFSRLTTSIPPHSPVAWANFISGTNPGGHGIFDFIARDPKTYLPHLSIAKVEAAKRTFKIGEWVLPMSGGTVECLRHGPPFWQALEEHGIPTTMFRIPSDFPPTVTGGRAISDLGTPDILGTWGTFSFYTSTPPSNAKDVSGGDLYMVKVDNGVIRTKLYGPRNDLRKGDPKCELDLNVYLDRAAPVAKIVVSGSEVLLREGEWSEWVRVHFPMLWRHGVSGVCRMYLKSVRPDFQLYVSPIQIDPAAPALPITTPGSYAQELARRFGPFYTQGMPEDTKVYSSGLFDADEYLQQSDIVLNERLAMYDYELGRFDEGLLFFYFSNTDRHGHMFWWARDPSHPAYDPKLAPRYADEIERIYVVMDGVVGKALKKINSGDTLMVMSDHGFAPYYRSFQLNSWLRENKYLVTWDTGEEQPDIFSTADWGYTKAYALGLNCLYLNVEGREGEGIVRPGAEQDALAREIAERLKSVRDPKNGKQVISNVYLARRDYSGPMVKTAPDLVIGYNHGYRGSWQTAIGQYTKTLIDDNDGKWSGDHCIDNIHVPGVLFSNKPVMKKPALYDLGPTVLAGFGVEKPKEMTGGNIL
jgi:predicted AlkP superfamily phosphohydrolase/phosphomutase